MRCESPPRLGYNAEMRFTLGKMFLAVAMLALAFAGIKYDDYLWTCLVYSVTMVLFVWVAMSAMKGAGSKRVALIWFVVVGTVYLLLTTCDSVAESSRYFVTNYLLAAVARFQHAIYTDYPLGAIAKSPPKNLFIIGHCVFSWIFAVLAAWFAGRMYDRRERATKEVT